MTREHERLQESRERIRHWKRWGPYLAERAWGTVREDYSATGEAWEYFPHDHARSRAYRWNEDGLAGICDRRQNLCFALALWNERDPILKERLFGLNGHEGNHGEDVKEYYFYLDSTPTHSYMKCLYKYPQGEYPYTKLVEENRGRGRGEPEYELLDTGIFDEDRYFDVFVEYAKADIEDICIRITVANRGPDAARLRLLPTLWFRNTWSWAAGSPKPQITGDDSSLRATSPDCGDFELCFAEDPEILVTENETNMKRLFGADNASPYVKDAFHEYLIHARKQAVKPQHTGTKAALHYALEIPAGGEKLLRLRLRRPKRGKAPAGDPLGKELEQTFLDRMAEADEFYQAVIPNKADSETHSIMRQAFAGLLWSKQFYHLVIKQWLEGDPAYPPPPPQRLHGRNSNWTHLYNSDVISMPDKWEYPWYAAWDLAFHCVALALVDPDFAKEQLVLITREWYMHPNGQLPAYEWAFGDVNPPVHAWAALQVYRSEQLMTGEGDRAFLVRIFHKLLLNFTWWVNRKDVEGQNVFQGGFLGLDNIGVFDRSAKLPIGGYIEQSDGTSWMAMYSLDLLAISLELAEQDPAYEDVASKFWEHFVYIARAMNHLGKEGLSLWSEEDGFFYDVLHLPEADRIPLKVRSMVGLIPLFAVRYMEPELLDAMPSFKRRMDWFIENRPDLIENMAEMECPGGTRRRLFSIVDGDQLRRILSVMLDESEFLSPYGVRALSRYHRDHPYKFGLDGMQLAVGYEPAESMTGVFGGNSNWRGPIWMPVNFLLIQSLRRFHHYNGDEFKVECPTGSGKMMTLGQVADELSQRLLNLFRRDANGNRPVNVRAKRFDQDPHWNYLQFYEFFHGDNGTGLGASHQTGWTALVVNLVVEMSNSKHKPEVAAAGASAQQKS